MATWYWQTPEKITAVEWCIRYRDRWGTWSDFGTGLVLGETVLDGQRYLAIGGPRAQRMRYIRSDLVKPLAEDRRLALGLRYPHEVTH